MPEPSTRGSSPQQQQRQQQPRAQRRSHRKSRNGCIECKRRHIRCDEGHPVCANCTIADRTCKFPPAKEQPPSRTILSPSHSQSSDTQSPLTHDAHQTSTHAEYQSPSTTTTTWDSSGGTRTPKDSAVPQAPPPPQMQSQPPASEPSPLPSFSESFPQSCDTSTSDRPLFTAEHLSLFYHLFASKEDLFMTPEQHKHLIEIAMRLSSTHPYLVDEVLALSALHKATTTSPQDSPHLLRIATELQTRAITCFTRLTFTLPTEDTDSIPRFLFAATLSLHDLAETLSSVRTLHQSQFHVFINRFVDCFRIHHGVHAVWRHFLTAELEPMLIVKNKARPNHEPDVLGESAAGDECRPLYGMLDSSDLGSATASACRAAVDKLQWAFDSYRNRRLEPAVGPHTALKFSITIGSEYIDILRRLQPEAVVILAYYSVLLHYCRRHWIFGNAGALIVRAIAQHFGVYWQGVMAWPLRMIEDNTVPVVEV